MPRRSESRPGRELDRELNEYASLMRALRTSHTLNLTTHLVEHLHGDAMPTHGRDQWTRWPLPDAAASEWDFADEIGVVIRHQFAKKRGERDIELDDAEEDYVQRLVEYLTPILVNFLERILAIVQDHTFARSVSMQDRINPLDWSDLANILASPAADDLVDTQMLKRYLGRMEALLRPGASAGGCGRRAAGRREMIDRRRAEQRALCGQLAATLFE